MSKRTQEFIEALKGEQSGGIAPSDNAVSRFFKEIGDEMKHLGAQGSHEMAAALFNGNAFVMYPHAGNDGVEQTPLHGPQVEPMKQPEAEQDRGGMER